MRSKRKAKDFSQVQSKALGNETWCIWISVSKCNQTGGISLDLYRSVNEVEQKSHVLSREQVKAITHGPTLQMIWIPLFQSPDHCICNLFWRACKEHYYLKDYGCQHTSQTTKIKDLCLIVSFWNGGSSHFRKPLVNLWVAFGQSQGKKKKCSCCPGPACCHLCSQGTLLVMVSLVPARTPGSFSAELGDPQCV